MLCTFIAHCHLFHCIQHVFMKSHAYMPHQTLLLCSPSYILVYKIPSHGEMYVLKLHIQALLCKHAHQSTYAGLV